MLMCNEKENNEKKMSKCFAMTRMGQGTSKRVEINTHSLILCSNVYGTRFLTYQILSMYINICVLRL